jgi:hypothetical protein
VEEDADMPRPSAIQVGRAAEHYVVAEIHRRGGWAACFGGNMPKIDVLASDRDQLCKITIQVKGKFGGSTWQTSIEHGVRWMPSELAVADDRFWIMVDLKPEVPAYFVMPERWIANNIYQAHSDYLAKHGGVRPGNNPDSTHHAIQVLRIEQWRDRWDVLGIFGDGSQPLRCCAGQ